MSKHTNMNLHVLNWLACTYIYLYTNMYLHLPTYKHVYTCINQHVPRRYYLYKHVYTCMYLHVPVTYKHPCAQTFKHVYTCIQSYIHVHTCMYLHVPVAYKHPCVLTYKDVHTCMWWDRRRVLRARKSQCCLSSMLTCI